MRDTKNVREIDGAIQSMQAFIRLPEVIRLTGMSRSWIYQEIAECRFPRPVKIGLRCIAWPASSILQWQQSRIDAAQKKQEVP